MATQEFPYVGNKYYITKSAGGFSGNSFGNANSGRGITGMNVLPNCTGFAVGRFNEKLHEKGCTYQFNGDAWTYVDLSNQANANVKKLKVASNTSTPVVGSIICWCNTNKKYSTEKGPGHVAVVESVSSDGNTITVSESGWNWSDKTTTGCFTRSRTLARNNGGSSNWNSSWMLSRASDGKYYKCLGFICPPGVTPSSATISTETSASKGGAYSEYDVNYKTETKTVTYQGTKTAEYAGTLTRTKSTSLLSYPTLVESPFVAINVGGYTFGTCSSIHVNSNNYIIDYPDFITGMKVEKINGAVNTYTISMTYQIRANDDPNLLDKIFSRVGYGNITISYGDWQSPTFIYKEETALITDITSTVDFSSSSINYVLSCTSTAVASYSKVKNFPAHSSAKPSKIIKDIFRDSSSGLKDIFYGMDDSSINTLVASDDKPVKIEAKNSYDVLSYINYLVSCMISNTNSDDAIIQDSSYYLTIHDDNFGDSGGPYFTVTKVNSDTGTIHSFDTYELDVGYPSDNMVMQFNIDTTKSWSLLYNYDSSTSKRYFTYNIDDNGDMIVNYSPDITTSANNYITTPTQKTWWTKMTQFPITATVTLKGLVRPAMLMQYVKINAMFYGQRHISSGLYFVTKQVDKIDGGGYRTTLSLTRSAGDDDYITTVSKEVAYSVPVLTKKSDSAMSTSTTTNSVNVSASTSSTNKTLSVSSSSIKNSNNDQAQEIINEKLALKNGRSTLLTGYSGYYWVPAGTTIYIKKLLGTSYVTHGTLKVGKMLAAKGTGMFTQITFDDSTPWYVKTSDVEEMK